MTDDEASANSEKRTVEGDRIEYKAGWNPPVFSTDETRTYFLAELPVHPEMVGFEQAHDRAHDEAHDQAHDALSETEAAILGFLATGDLRISLSTQWLSEMHPTELAEALLSEFGVGS